MEQTTNDRALIQALTPKESRKLPSNFPYLTMRRIKEKQRMEERRQHVIAIVTIVAVSLAGISTFLFLFWDQLCHSLTTLCSQPDAFVLVLPTLFCLAFFALLNHWLSQITSNKL
jgi:uncharacterized membrane protein